MTDLIILTAIWAYTLRAAWTGGVIKAYSMIDIGETKAFQFWLAVAFWPVTLWAGYRERESND